MKPLKCSDYGFDCEFEINGLGMEVIVDFKNHMENEHGISYPQEAVMQIILRTKNFS